MTPGTKTFHPRACPARAVSGSRRSYGPGFTRVRAAPCSDFMYAVIYGCAPSIEEMRHACPAAQGCRSRAALPAPDGHAERAGLARVLPDRGALELARGRAAQIAGRSTGIHLL